MAGRWKHVLACALLFVSFTVTAPASAGVCSDLFSSAKNYFREVRQSKGVRLLVAPATEHEARERLYGFISARGWPSPLNGLNYVLVEKPADALVRAAAGPKKRASFLAKLPLLAAWALAAHFYVIEPVTDHAMTSRIADEIAENAVVFERLIAEDYRFEAVRLALQEGSLTQEDAREQAYMISKAYSSYYSYRDGYGGELTLEDNMGLLDHYLFSHLRPLIEGAIAVPEGFRAAPGFAPRIGDKQRQRLFHLTHALYLRYQLIDGYVNGTLDPALAGLRLALQNEPFTRRLQAELDAGRISRARFQRALQEHVYWDYRLKIYAVIGLEKINGSTGNPALLEDYDNEILSDL